MTDGALGAEKMSKPHDMGCPWVLLTLSHQEVPGALSVPHVPQEAWPHSSQLRTQMS